MGVDTFQLLPPSDAGDAHVHILPIAFDGTVCGRKGTRAAPEAILAASADLEYYDEACGWSPFEHLLVHVAPLLDCGTHDAPVDVDRQITERAALLQQDLDMSEGRPRLLIGLGGEHSITPSLTAAALPHPGTVVVFDAHADLRQTYQGNGFSHATTVYRLREQGHRALLIGVRSMTNHEAARIETDREISCHTADSLHSDEIVQRLQRELSSLSGPIWISLDCDGFDPSVIPSVGTPQPGGLSWHFVMRCLYDIFNAPEADVKGLDVVEMIPDPLGVSQTAAAKLVFKCISLWGYANTLHHLPKAGSQTRVTWE
ncbi:MAG: arginase family protein [Pseudomonadota bacterium]